MRSSGFILEGSRPQIRLSQSKSPVFTSHTHPLSRFPTQTQIRSLRTVDPSLPRMVFTMLILLKYLGSIPSLTYTPAYLHGPDKRIKPRPTTLDGIKSSPPPPGGTKKERIISTKAAFGAGRKKRYSRASCGTEHTSGVC